MKIPLLKCLISIYLLRVQLNFSMIRIFLQNQIWLIGFQVMSNFVQVVISQNELKLLGSLKTESRKSEAEQIDHNDSITYIQSYYLHVVV